MKIFYRAAALTRNVFWQVFRPVVIGVKVAVFDEDNILLVKTSYSRHWQLPGGAVDRNETLESAAARELLEESGIGTTVDSLELVGIFLNKYHGSSNHTALFLSKNWEQKLSFKPNAEIVAVDFFPIKNLPQDIGPYNKFLLEQVLSELRSGKLIKSIS